MEERPETVFKMSAEPGPLFEALSKLQSEVATAKKGGKNPHFRSHFTRMEDAVLAVQEHLNGLSVSQYPAPIRDGQLYLRTVVGHSSGAWIVALSSIPVPKSDPQGVGSAMTYLRRYAFLAALGLAPSDDDGETAQPDREEPQKRPSARRQPPAKKEEPKGEAMTEATREKLRAAVAEAEGVTAVTLARRVCGKHPRDCDEQDGQDMLRDLGVQ